MSPAVDSSQMDVSHSLAALYHPRSLSIVNWLSIMVPSSHHNEWEPLPAGRAVQSLWSMLGKSTTVRTWTLAILLYGQFGAPQRSSLEHGDH